MDTHRTYKKETILGEDDVDEDDEFTQQNDSNETNNEKEKSSFIWTFLIRPVHDTEKARK